jgi:predicted transposase YbfD/YdcC
MPCAISATRFRVGEVANKEFGVSSLGNRKMPTPIVKIREVIKDIRFDFRTERTPKAVLKRLVSCMEGVGDGRVQGMIDYPLPYILLLAFLAVLSNAESWIDMEIFSNAYKTRLNGILPQYKNIPVPSHDTFRRVFGIISPDELQRATCAFLVLEIGQLKKALGVEDEGLRHLGLDGKEQKGTGRKYGTDQKIANLQTLHCYDITNGICLHSVPIDSKTNEIPTAQTLLKTMNLKDCVVTFDAMNTQRDTVGVIIGGGGHYVGGLKGNQQLFHKEVELLFSDEELMDIKKKGKHFFGYTEKAHNRIEKRSYYMNTDIEWFEDLHKWAGLKSFICYDIETEDLVSGKKTHERRFYISSLADIEMCADAIRSHWGIENQLHWHLDVTFSEDDNTTIDKNAFNNLSIMNKMILTLLKLIQPAYKVGLKSIRKRFGWELEKNLIKLLSLLDEEQIEEALLRRHSKSGK